ncbi:coproporphyrinogen dehydrogenase HemZ [Sedimentibacter sp. MB31-C6]|uniref:coproporphyrinogen dehydrogenase HemZ n=1 Tax=Sedimentibacter sp. MB31-C6 TaxID=3109366 RepID=UPI002DDD87EC|nr:coproporphyrinogen dehydrogenase HemZ [Sedimentibacter sp. MB36-C1]WSI04470.1 coproporphyrinogen dehydrogenase HemZ [Sedimentibacter sp. MB36-C1]
MINFYFEGHNFEYEVRNALRVFDLNIKYKIRDTSEISENTGLGLFTIIEKQNDDFVGKAKLYKDNEELFKIEIKGKDIILEKENEKKLKKIVVVKSVHNVFKNYYKITPEYGLLIGVRPVKILFVAKNSGKSKAEINRILKDTYEVSLDKIKLLWDVLEIEEKYIKKEYRNKNYNLYIGVPFCPTKCSYCSFTSYINKEGSIEKYLKTLKYEIEKSIQLALEKNLKLNSIYIGGGTPSILNEKQINMIFDSIRKYYDLSSIKEISFEAGRPDTIDENMLYCLKKNYVNRISINPQTMKQSTLDIIGRKHSVKDIKDKYLLARKIKFNSINMDIILGLPNEDENEVNHTINEIIKLKPDNITVHALAYKRNSLLTKQSLQYSKEYNLLKNMQKIVEERCLENNYKPYYMYRQKNIKGNLENVGFAIKNKECIYNMIIIEENETILACGAGASSKIMVNNDRHKPIHNFKGLDDYNNRIDEIIEKKIDLIREIPS